MSRYDDIQESKSNNISPMDAPSLTWFQIWWLAISQPNAYTFQMLLNDPLARAQRGYLWVFITGGIWGTFVLAFEPSNGVGILPALFLGIPVGGTISLIFFIFTGWLIQRIAIAVGGDGTFGNLHYLRACFTAPLNLMNIALIPLSGMAGIGTTLFLLVFQLFQLYLLGIALRVVNHFAWSQAIMVLSALFLVSMVFSSILLSSLLPS